MLGKLCEVETSYSWDGLEEAKFVIDGMSFRLEVKGCDKELGNLLKSLVTEYSGDINKDTPTLEVIIKFYNGDDSYDQ